MLGVVFRERSLIDNPHRIQTLVVQWTPEMRWHPLTPQSLGISSSCRDQDLSGLVHTDPFSPGITPVIKGDSLGTWHQVIPRFNQNKYRQDRIPYCKYHIITPSRYFLNIPCNLLKRGNKWGLQRLQSWHRQYLKLWIKNTPMGCRYRSSNKQHRIRNSNSHAVVRRLKIWDQRLQ